MDSNVKKYFENFLGDIDEISLNDSQESLKSTKNNIENQRETSNNKNYVEDFLGNFEKLSLPGSNETLSSKSTKMVVKTSPKQDCVDDFHENVDTISLVESDMKMSQKSHEALDSLNKTEILAESVENIPEITSNDFDEDFTNETIIDYKESIKDLIEFESNETLASESENLIVEEIIDVASTSESIYQNHSFSDCACSREDYFDKIIKKTVEFVEKIENENQEIDEEKNIQVTMNKVEQNLETELEGSLRSLNSEVDLRSCVRVIIDALRSAMSRCRIKKRPVTSTMKRLLSEKISPQEIKKLEAQLQEVEDTELNQIDEKSFYEDSIVEKLRKIIFKVSLTGVDQQSTPNFSKVQIKSINFDRIEPRNSGENSKIEGKENFKESSTKSSSKILERATPWYRND